MAVGSVIFAADFGRLHKDGRDLASNFFDAVREMGYHRNKKPKRRGRKWDSFPK